MRSLEAGPNPDANFAQVRRGLAGVSLRGVQDRTQCAAKDATLCEALEIPLRTLQRWRRWWREDFMQTPLWQAMCARFMPPVSAEQLPADLLARFAGEDAEALPRLLCFLAPITVRAATLPEGR